jgi:predicted nucleotide-binding protein (sugar kinase/HSP70/actin superfamily)
MNGADAASRVNSPTGTAQPIGGDSPAGNAPQSGGGSPSSNQPPTEFRTLTEKVGKFGLTGKKALIPDLCGAGSQLLAATMRSFGINAEIMETYKGLNLGKKYTSGKECFPCQVTLGDFLYHMEKERERLGDEFDPANYIYCLAEADGPCRFGMYTKLHRIVLDSLDGFHNTRIAYVTCGDNYSAEGLVPPESQPTVVRMAVFGFLVGDILDRILWRTRPYERQPGAAESLFEDGLARLVRLFELHGKEAVTGPMLDELEQIAIRARATIDPSVPPKPMIGLVGEIYVRSHRASNKDLILMLERHGAEVVNASITEWVHYIIYHTRQRAARDAAHALRRGDLRAASGRAMEWLRQGLTLIHQERLVSRAYGRVMRHLPIRPDHRIASIERQLDKGRIFSFRMCTEAPLSIGGALEYHAHGFDGVVNVLPFGCMPSTTTSAVLKPVLDRLRLPYIDSQHDGTDQPNREAIIRTFMYQATQHQRSRRSQRQEA